MLRPLMFQKINFIWLLIGFTAQAMFSGRFLIQWIASEIKRKSVIPVAFWYLSILGSLGLLTYAIHRRDPVFIMGQSFGLVIYLRNLYFIKQSKTVKGDNACNTRSA